MTVYYVRDTGSNTAPYDTWAKAATSLAVVTAIPVAAADTIWVSDDHNETGAAGATKTWTCPTTPGLKILCANGHVSMPPTGQGTGATIATTTTGAMIMNGYAYVYGINFQVGSGSSSTNMTFGQTGTLVTGITLESCLLYVVTTNTSAYIGLGGVYSGGIGPCLVRVINCTMRFSATGQIIRLGLGRNRISGLSFDASSTAPTTLFQFSTTNTGQGDTLVENSDLSGKTWTNLCTVSSISNTFMLDVRNSKLPASITVVTGSFAAYGAQRVRLHNCDSGDTHIRFAEHQYAGVITSDTAITRTGGSVQDDTQGYSVRMTGNANTSILYPLYSPEVWVWNTVTGSARTLTMSFIRDSVTNLTDAEVWVEASYQGTAGFPLGTKITDRVATVSGTAADQAADSGSTWANSMTNPNKQAAHVTFTPQEVGQVFARMALGANTAINVDILPVLT
jgi:hypothetical protein